MSGKKIAEKWEMMKGKLRVAMKETERKVRKERRKEGWWDDKCRRMKEKVRRELIR